MNKIAIAIGVTWAGLWLIQIGIVSTWFAFPIALIVSGLVDNEKENG